MEHVAEAQSSFRKYKYRTASGVARDAKIPLQTAQKILSSNPNIRVAKARDGKEVYAPR